MTVFAAAGLAILLVMAMVFMIALFRRDNSLVDIFYGPCGVAGAASASLAAGASHPRQVLLLVLVAVWGVRLSIHLAARKRGKGEDFRYRAWRESWGRWFVLRSLLQIYLLQGAVLWVVLLPLLLAMRSPGGALGLLDLAGALVWSIGFFFEAVGDWQLVRFVRDPARRGRFITSGLWRLTRHPNYFGEATLWWGVFLVGLGAPHGWVGVASPLLIGALLLFVSGIPLLEKRWEGDPEWEAYRSRTSAFVPWFPRREGDR